MCFKLDCITGFCSMLLLQSFILLSLCVKVLAHDCKFVRSFVKIRVCIWLKKCFSTGDSKVKLRLKQSGNFNTKHNFSINLT